MYWYKIKQKYPGLRICKSFKKFIYLTSYINNWKSYDECEECLDIHKPNMTKLYHYYLTTKYVPYFTPLVISFVHDVIVFMESNKSAMYITCEDLLIHWQN